MRTIVLRDGLYYLEVESRRVCLCRDQRDDDGHVILFDVTLPQLADQWEKNNDKCEMMEPPAGFRGRKP
jgi:hypothetical protein